MKITTGSVIVDCCLCVCEISCDQPLKMRAATQRLQRLKRHQSAASCCCCCLMTTVWSPMSSSSPLDRCATVGARPSRGADQGSSAFQFHARRETNDSTRRRTSGTATRKPVARLGSVDHRARRHFRLSAAIARRTGAPEGQKSMQRVGPTRPGITLTGLGQ